jgi:hypothetical protein
LPHQNWLRRRQGCWVLPRRVCAKRKMQSDPPSWAVGQILIPEFSPRSSGLVFHNFQAIFL